MHLPESPRLFLVDGYALIYRAFFAMIARPLRSSRGENTSAAWGVTHFLQRLLETHKPEYLGWVHDSGLSFRHEAYPAYKATRQKLTDELQDDFDTGMQRICQLLDAYGIPILSLAGYEADDVIGTLAAQSVAAKLNVVVVSGDKDFQQLVRPGVWLLNPGRGGPSSIEEQWVGVDNAVERLGVSPERVIDYLALVGDSSDNVPGVPGIGDKTARELVSTYGPVEEILAHAEEIGKKRPREALLEHAARARLSKELVTIRCDLPIALDVERLRVPEPSYDRLKELFIELEFHSLIRERVPEAPATAERRGDAYITVDTVDSMRQLVRRAREAGTIAVDTVSVIDPASPNKADALRSSLVSVSIAVAPGEAYYIPLAHRARYEATQGTLLLDAAGDRAPTDSPEDRGLVWGGDEPQDRGGARGDSMAALGDPDGNIDDRGGPPVPPAATKPARKRKAAASAAEPASIAARALAARGAQPVRNLPPLASPAMQELRELLEDPRVKKTAQNAKYDVLTLRRAGVTLRGLDFDTMLASYVLDPGRRSHGLDVLALEFLDHTMTSYEELCGKGKGQIPFDQCPVEAARDYSCEEADMTLQLRAVFEPQLAEMGLTRLLEEVEVPLVDALAEMEWTGVAIDTNWFASLKQRFKREREEAERAIREEAGTDFNINSNPQLRHVLFEKLQLPILKRTATGASTDATVLQQLADAGHTLPALLMEYRELAKLESTYIDALPALVHPETGRIHTSFNQTVATTGRLSSSDPNLQNIPIRRELGRDIRRGFIPRGGWRFLAADYSQIELRLLAHLSGDPAFVDAFRAGGDIHRQTASIIFEIPLEEVTPEMRGRAKTINFATIYGQGPHALSRQLKIEYQEARHFIEQYFERFSGIRSYLDGMVELARQQGYVQTIFGRRRYIPELRDRSFNVRAFGERTATNSPIQGSAADLIKIAMIRIHRLLRERGLMSRMILQVHDELVFEAPVDELEPLQELVRHEMENAARLEIPLVVDVRVGENWLAAK
ncbi:MAG: DNA polymerase I [Gemmatimonadota bacterium]|nr:DNA polymerase I [Gemmatimonadota bacterium]